MAVPTTRATSLVRIGVVIVLAVVAAACDSDSGARHEDPGTSLPATAGSDVSARWAHTMSGPTNEDEFDGVAASPDGSVYVTGKFEGTAALGGVSLESVGAADIPFARFDAQDNRCGRSASAVPGRTTSSTSTRTPTEPSRPGCVLRHVAFGSITLTSSGPCDCVIVALAPDGKTRWARAVRWPGSRRLQRGHHRRERRVTTSIDTQGEWTPLGGSPLPRVPRRTLS